MNMRYFSSAPLGLMVTAGLLWLMQTLIATGPGVYMKPRPRIELGWILRKGPEVVVVDEQPFKRPEPPAQPPKLEFPSDDSGTIVVPAPPPAEPRAPDLQPTDFGVSDGPLVNVIDVQPVYPADAARRALEGFVTLEFDVTELGTVANIVVIESSHRIFEKPARDAALRSRFRPRVVDGVALPTTGVVRRYRFKMDE